MYVIAQNPNYNGMSALFMFKENNPRLQSGLYNQIAQGKLDKAKHTDKSGRVYRQFKANDGRVFNVFADNSALES